MKRYFWRRAVAYLGDLFVIAIFFTALALALAALTGKEVLAPSIINSSNCEDAQVVSPDEMHRLLPLPENGQHFQLLCPTTYMFVSKSLIAVLGHVVVDDGVISQLKIEYPVDWQMKPVKQYPIDPLLYLALPFILAWFIAKKGTTPAKSLMGLKIQNDDGQRPTFKAALKRECFKNFIFFVSAAISIYFVMTQSWQTPEALAAIANELDSQLNNLGLAGIVPVLIMCALLFWFFFGSFIRWNGKTYWDRFAETVVVHRGHSKPD